MSWDFDFLFIYRTTDIIDKNANNLQNEVLTDLDYS